MQSKSGIVIKSTGSWYRVLAEDKNYYDCRIKGKFRQKGLKATNPICVGDRVDFHYDTKLCYAVIDHIHERQNYLARKASNLSKQYHIIASNLDLAVLITTVDKPAVSPGFIDRFLVIAEAHEIKPVIIFNKSDIEFSDETLARQHYLMELYKILGYKVLHISAKQGWNIEEVIELLKYKTSLFAGQSGVGKSTLLKKLNPELTLKTAEISDYTGKGVHATTFYEMHEISEKTYIIDSPGLKELGLFEFEPFEISLFYPEMKKIAENCRFNTCLHVNEPGCAVIDAFEKNLISYERYMSYLKIIEDFKNEKPYYSKS